MFDSQKQLTWAKLRVGVVITLALAILFVVILFAGSVASLLTPRAAVSAVFDDVKGLRPGAPVWFAGVQIGSVKSLRLDAGETITITMTVERAALSYLKKDSRASILTMGLLGDKYVEVTPGTREAGALHPGDTITGTSRAEITDELRRLLEGTGGKKGTLTRLLQEDTLYRDLAASVRDIRLFARTLRESDGTVNHLVKDPALYDRFLKATESLDVFSRKLASSKGTLNRLVEDASLYENVNAAAVNLNALLEKVNKGEGAMGGLISDAKLKEELSSTLKELNTLVKDIRQNPKKYFSFSMF